ncbi:thioesterase II family protein [Sphaerimonospora cavernae]|uniref:Thioesterase II family protein n=1 Tax=Sphaerimonospora cavernae TaxID=1740611 RepID=A0ABV6TYZ4_9ACTN
MTTIASPGWIHRLTPAGGAAVRLYCFPFAGGSASAYRPWAALFPPDVELAAVQLPGRQERYSEPAVTDLRSLVPDISRAIAADLDGRPYGLYGHSMGTILAYEVAVELARAGAAKPELLAVSGRRAPHAVDPDFVPYHQMPDEAFLHKIEALGGIAPELAEHRDLLDLMLPVLRADFTAVETYQARPQEPLVCRILVFSGDADPHAPRDGLERWRELSTAGTSIHIYPGGHFFLWEHSADLIARISDTLRGVG